MPNVLAMSFEGALAPSLRLRCGETNSAPPDGWGVAYYARDELAATILKDAVPAGLSALTGATGPHEQVESSQFIVHMRTARWGSRESLADTQPFSRPYGGRDWTFAHGGSIRDRIEVAGDRAVFEPIGSTDSEAIFCELMTRISERRWRNLGYADFGLMREWMLELNQHGEMTCVLSDGRDVIVYADQKAELYAWELNPPHEQIIFHDDQLEIDLSRRGIKSRHGVVVSSSVLQTSDGIRASMNRIEPGTLLVMREGHISLRASDPAGQQNPQSRSTFIVHPRQFQRPRRAEVKTFKVLHETAYRYDTPIEHSAHMFRLTPIHDELQNVISHEIDISVDGRERHYEDAFGNQVTKLVVETPYTELKIVARTTVAVLDVDPLAFRPLHARTNLPLVWMPWQAQILTPYLLPPELPETQLLELIDFSMSFVNRNDSDLLETLIDINSTIYRDFEYVPGATTLSTSAYEVYSARRGVCQDFTNLFICLARLLGLPARYMCGYIYTGPKNPNQIQSEASHAWVQVYLPEVGWKGFDPTNGIITQTDHVRVAVGRNYLDATPTSGTIYVGGGPETLSARVVVEPVEDASWQQGTGSDGTGGFGGPGQQQQQQQQAQHSGAVIINGEPPTT